MAINGLNDRGILYKHNQLPYKYNQLPLVKMTMKTIDGASKTSTYYATKNLGRRQYKCCSIIFLRYIYTYIFFYIYLNKCDESWP